MVSPSSSRNSDWRWPPADGSNRAHWVWSCSKGKISRCPRTCGTPCCCGPTGCPTRRAPRSSRRALPGRRSIPSWWSPSRDSTSGRTSWFVAASCERSSLGAWRSGTPSSRTPSTEMCHGPGGWACTGPSPSGCRRMEHLPQWWQSSGHGDESPIGLVGRSWRPRKRSVPFTPTATGRAPPAGRWSCGQRGRTSTAGWMSWSVSPDARSWPVTLGRRSGPGARSRKDATATTIRVAWAPRTAAGERLAAAAHLRSAASFVAALRLLQTARDEARSAERVRSGLTMALDRNLTGAAAEVYQRLADSLEHAGDYRGAEETYQAALSFCATNALQPTAQLCLACLTVVVRQAGDWDRATALCRQVIASPEATMHARAVATGTLGSILGARGQTRRARPLLLESASLARHIELAAMELLAAWGLALVEQVAGTPGSAAERCLSILERWQQTEERHYAIPPLRWATTLLAESGDGRGARACAAALAHIATDAGQDEAMSALSHSLGELALLEGNPEQAAVHFGRALELLRSVGAPFERAESQRRAAGALVMG